MAARENSDELMVDSVYRKLFGIILSKDLRPGDRLPVDHLSRELNVSQTPVRQALARLQSHGLVSNKPNSGFRVSNLPTRKHLLDTLKLRIIIESAFTSLATDNSDSETFEKLDNNLQDMENFIQEGATDFMQMFQIDAAFHAIIAEAAGNKVGADLLKDLLRRSSVFRLSYQPGMPQEVLREHSEIAEAIKSGAKKLAIEKMTDHLTISIGRVQDAD